MSGPAPAIVRVYLDADVLGLAKALAPLRNDVTYPGGPGGEVHRRRRRPCPITGTATLDREWIPVTAQHGRLIVTRDSRIRERRAEIEAVRLSPDPPPRFGLTAGRDTRMPF